MEVLIILLVIVLVHSHFQKIFKIAYYETKLENRNVDISIVKNMAFYKLWLNLNEK